jgi:hypothetical protein
MITEFKVIGKLCGLSQQAHPKRQQLITRQHKSFPRLLLIILKDAVKIATHAFCMFHNELTVSVELHVSQCTDRKAVFTMKWHDESSKFKLYNKI